MFDYSQISSRTFEKIAKEYLEDKYPDFHWDITPSSGDGNKDILCQYKVLGQEQEYWAEVKFTKSTSPHTLMKGQLDPTLISALLSPKPVSLCFISNNQMTENYLYRLNDFRIKTNIGIELVLKDEFEQWLLNNPAISQKYNIKVISLDASQKTTDTNILAATITDIFNLNQYKIETHLVEKTIYYLYLIINGSENIENISLEVNDEFAFPMRSRLFDNPDDLHIKHGKQVCKFELLPLQTGKTDLNIRLIKDKKVWANYILPDLVITPSKDLVISYVKQEKTQCEIIQRISEADAHNFLIPITGTGSVGKSKLAQDLYVELNTDNNVIMLSFVENEYLDMKTLIQVMLFFNIGNIFDYDRENLIPQIDMISDKEKKIYYATLIEGFFESPGPCISYLKSKILQDDFSLIYPSFSRVRQILILEDVHKASKGLQEILHRFISQFLQCKSNQYFILTSREYYKDFVINVSSLKKDWIATYSLCGLTKEDKLTTLNYYFSFNGDIQFDRTTDDLIIFSNILQSKLDLTESRDFICRNAELIGAFEKPQLVNVFHYKEQLNQLTAYHNIIECIYYVNFGIEVSILSKYFQYKNIETLIERKVIKRIGKKLFPFHDHYVKAYFEDHKISVSTIIFLKELSLSVEQDEEKYLYLSLLIRSGYSEYCQVEKEAHELEYHYFKITDYYKAYILANAFKEYMNFDECLSLQEIYDLFILAVSSGYFHEPKEVRENYNKVIQFSRTLPLSRVSLGITLRAQSEIINIDYWELEIENLAETIVCAIKQVPDITCKDSDDLICAYLNLLNRKMVVCLLLEDYEQVNIFFKENLDAINMLKREEYKGYLYMDYAKGLYNRDLEIALRYMQKAQNIFETLGTEHRRLLDCNCEIEYLKCIQSDQYDLCNLEYAAEELNNSRFIELYSKARLKIAAVKMVRGGFSQDDIEKELLLSKHVLKYDFTGRLALLYKMLRNALDIHGHTMNNYAKLTNDEKKKLCMMGDDYQKVWRHNEKPFKKNVMFLSEHSLPNEYVLDARIW